MENLYSATFMCTVVCFFERKFLCVIKLALFLNIEFKRGRNGSKNWDNLESMFATNNDLGEPNS
jgi:hypothetical protein